MQVGIYVCIGFRARISREWEGMRRSIYVYIYIYIMGAIKGLYSFSPTTPLVSFAVGTLNTAQSKVAASMVNRTTNNNDSRRSLSTK